MIPLAKLHETWESAFRKLRNHRFFMLAEAGQLTLDHYKSFLRQCYFNTRETPIIMSAFAVRMGSHHQSFDALRKFLRHAASETGHHLMAQADLKALGEDTQLLPRMRPPAATQALAAFILHEIQYANPVAYIGYSYHLEAMAVYSGPGNMERLKAQGVPANAMKFLEEHATVDTQHLKFHQEYLDRFVFTEDDWKAVVYGVDGSCRLYGVMLDGILEEVEGARVY